MRSSTKFGQLIRFKSGLLAIKYALFPLIIVAAQLAFGQTPTTQVSGITFEPVPGPNQNTTIKINWATNGNGGNRLVVLKDATGVFNPVDNTNTSTFNANADYTANVTDLDAGAGVVKAVAVISGGGQTITVTNIPANTMLAVQIFEFGDSPASPDYNLATNATNPRSFQFFTSNGTFTVPANITAVRVQALGGGGGGGGADSNGTDNRAGGGGAGGSYTEASIAVTPAANIAVTVGSGGSGGLGGDDAAQDDTPVDTFDDGIGLTGGLSSFSSISAIGGAGGDYGRSNNALRTGNGGATTAGATHNGGAGTEAPPTGNNPAEGGGGGGGSAGTTGSGSTGSGSTGGNGGSGGGGQGASGASGQTVGNGVSVVGSNASQFGGGGGGGWDNRDNNNTFPGAKGGDGASGYVIVSYDNTPPTAIITRGTPTTQYTNATSVTFTVTFNETVTGVSPDGSDFSASPTGGLSLTTPTISVTGTNPYNVTVSTLAGEGNLDLNFAGGQDIKDASGNPFGGTTSGDQVYTRETVAPVAAPIISVTTNPAGTVVAGYYNLSNQTNTAGLTVRVTVANDATLVGGTIQVRVDDQVAAGFVSLGAAETITGTDVTNGYKDIVITHAQLAGLTGRYANNKILSFQARINDQAGNGPTDSPTFGSTLTIDLVAPPAPPAPLLLASSDSGSSNSDGNTNDTTPTFENASAGVDGVMVTINSSIDGNVGSMAIASNNYAITTSALQQGTHTITATTTEASGNVASSTSISVTIDTDGNAATAFGLTVDSGVSSSDLITNDDRFNATTSAGFKLELMEGASVLVTIASASAGVNTLNPTVALSDGAHTIFVRTTDIAGNTADTAPLAVTIDTQNPSVTVNQAADPGFASALFNVVFNEPIAVPSFIAGDFVAANFNTGTQTGELISSGPTEVAPNDGTTFQVGVTGTSTTPSTIILTLNATTVTDIAGNPNSASTSTDNSITFTPQPSTPPTSVTLSGVSQFAMTVNRSGGNGTTYLWVARAGAAVDFVPMDGTDYSASASLDFNAGTAVDANGNKILALANNANRDITGLDPSTTYHFALFALHGTGANSNYNPTPTANSQATTACTYPAAASNLGSSANTNSITLTFDRATNVEHYIIVFKSGSIPVSAPVGGIDYTGVDNLAFGSAGPLGDGFVVYAGEPNNSTSMTHTVTGLSTGTTYGFAIYTYNNTTFCYQATGLTGTRTTSAAAAAELTLASSAALTEPSTISSLGTALTGAVGPQTNAVQNFDFTVQDGADGAEAFISQIVINQGASNQITNWADAISQARLSDGVNTQILTAPNANIGASSITFSSIPNTGGTLGHIASGASKTYTLTIALKTGLGVPLPTTIDGLQFDFTVNTAGITAGGGGSTMAAAQTVSSPANTNRVAVVASQITVELPQPSAAAIANAALGTQPQFRAKDANNNTDTGFNFGLTVATTPSNLNPTSAPASFTSGVANFAASGFKFLNPGTAAMNVTANSLTSSNTNSITVTSTTTLGSATSGITSNALPFGNSQTNKVVLGFSLVTDGSAHDVTGLTFNTPVNATDLMTNFRIYSNSSDVLPGSGLSVSPSSSTGTTLSFTGLSLPITSSTTYFWLVADVRASYLIATPAILDFSLATTGITEAIAGTNKAGSTQSGLSYTVSDNVSPTIVSIVRQGLTPNRTGTVDFVVTFSEAVNIADDADFNTTGTALCGLPTHTGSGTTYTISVSGITAEGTLGLNVVTDNGSIEDLAGNPLLAGLSSVALQVYVQEPTSSVTNFQITTTTTTSMTLTWTDVASFPPPIAYLITAERSGATATVPVDLNDVADQTDLINNTTGYLTVAPGDETATFSSLLSGANYNFYIYPYTNISPNRDYRTTTAATVSGATPIASKGRIDSSPNNMVISNISSLTTAAFLAPAALFETVNPTTNFFIVITDDGLANDDNAKTLISQFVVKASSLDNNVPNWDEIIEEAKLRAFLGTGLEVDEATTTTIGTNTITFNLSTADDRIGEIDDGEAKFYQLYIRLENPLVNANSAPSLIDGKRFEFMVDASSFTYATGSSQIDPAQTGTSDNITPAITANTNNKVNVLPTELRYVQQPTTNTYIGNAMTPLVSVEATDANGNRDLDYTTPNFGIASSGTLQSAVSVVPVQGFQTASITHSVPGTGLTLTASSGGLTPVVSNSFNILVDNKSDIVHDPGFTDPSNVQYASYQDANISGLSTGNVTVSRFLLRDGGATHTDLDGAPTTISDISFNLTGAGASAIRKVAIFRGSTFIQEAAPTGSGPSYTVNFSGFSISTGADATDAIINLKVSFKNSAPSVIDNTQFQFAVTSATVTNASSGFLAATPFATAVSQIGVNQNTIEVCGTQFRFINNLGNPTLPLKDIGLQQATPQLDVTDANLLRDLDFNSPSISVTSIGILMNPGGTNPITLSASNGLINFPSNFQYQTTGNGTLTISTTTTNTCGGSVSNVASNVITVQAGLATRIAAGTSAPASISSLVNTSGAAVSVLNFDVQDDFGAAPSNDDGLPTLITTLSITPGSNNQITQWNQAIAGAELWSGATSIAASSIKADTIKFTGIATGIGQLGYVANDATKSYILKIFLKANMAGSQNYPINIDGQQFDFEIQASNISIGANSTGFVAGEKQRSGASKDIVDVTASRVDITTQPHPLNISTFSPINTPYIVAEARDVNANRDTGYNGAIGTVTNSGGLSMSISPSGIPTGVPTGNFSSGVYDFQVKAPDFKFLQDSGLGTVTLTVPSGALTAGVSNAFKVSASYDSYLFFDRSFTPATRIDFVTAANQGTTPSASSQTIGRLILSDGGGPTSTFNLLNNPTPASSPLTVANTTDLHNDSDGAFTQISGLTINLGTTWNDILALRLFAADGTTPLTGAVAVTGPTVSFTGLTLQAPDDGTVAFLVKATFDQTIAQDLVKLDMQVGSATWNSGSQFAEQLATYAATHIGGISGGDEDPDGPVATPFNQLDVIMTQLDFTEQPSGFAGINEPIGDKLIPLPVTPYAHSPLTTTNAGTVEARDKFGNRDREVNGAPTKLFQKQGNTTVTSVPNFINGVLLLDGIEYTVAGNGTLVVERGSVSSDVAPSVGCNPVTVIHVTATYPAAGNGLIVGSGTPPSFSMKAGSPNQVIFGVTFTADGATASEPNLKSFSITFDKSFKKVTGGVTTDIFEGFKVLKGSDDITGVLIDGDLRYSSTIPADGLGSQNKITVDLSNNPQQIPAGTTGVTYYLVANVSSTANISTPDITPSLSDLGFTDRASDTTIVLTNGTATGAFIGNKYSFASTRPPKLLTGKNSLTYPLPGQLNVEANLDTIKLEFDVAVTSLDGGQLNGAELYRRSDNVKVANLLAKSGPGNYKTAPFDYTKVVKPLTYGINFLPGFSFVPDEVYFVKIKKGKFDPITLQGEGISDEGLNFYGGIQDNATLYFKISSDKPIKLQSISEGFINSQIGSINTSFDQFGTAYYMAVRPTKPKPTIAQIKNPALYTATKAAFGNFTITKVNDPQTVTFPANFKADSTYHIYVYAENDALPSPPVSSGGVYGSDKLAGTAGATLTITLRSTDLDSYDPKYLICPSSFVDLTEPIIIGEKTRLEFKKLGNQDMNILLPNGYEFDRSVDPKIQLIGSDWGASIASWTYFSNTILNIQYTNDPTPDPIPPFNSFDYIVISNLRVKGAAGSNQLPIRRFYGTNTFIVDPVAKVASIGLTGADEFEFTNSYSIDNSPFPVPSPSIVNSIPDNYVDKDQTIPGSIRLVPLITVPNDYNASTFSGNGVDNGLLTLNAVPTDAAFDISMTHIDPNGCKIETTQQYLVYDHIAPISAKLGDSYIGNTDPLKAALAGSTQAIVNSNFSLGLASPTLTSQTLLHNEKAGFELITMSADLPTTEIRLNALGRRSQIMSGLAWQTEIKKIVNSPTFVNVTTPIIGSFANYTVNYAHVLNAFRNQPTIGFDPYDGDPTFSRGFKVTLTNGNVYWTGGSLGNVEFTGVYQSTADAAVKMPFRQNVELFVPPVPIIEISTSPTNRDLADPLNIGGATLLFCEQGGAINITGFPNASSVSKGKFILTNVDSTAIAEFGVGPLAKYTGSGDDDGFIDNGNGTATLYPFINVGGSNRGIINNYRDIKIWYTFQENNSPASGSGSIIIRITPNPTAQFTASSLWSGNRTMVDPNDITKTLRVRTLKEGRPNSSISYCEDNVIGFNNTSNWTDVSRSLAVKKTIWSYGDNTANDTTRIRSAHTFQDFGSYSVSLQTQSQFGCPSLSSSSTLLNPIVGPTTQVINVGEIPKPSIAMNGISTGAPLNAVSTSTLSTGSNSVLSLAKWNFGDPWIADTTYLFTAGDSKTYSKPGHYKLTLLQGTNLGCEVSYQRDVVIVPDAVASPITRDYFDDLETSKWQVDDGIKDDSTRANPPQNVSWRNMRPINFPAHPNLLLDSVWVTNKSKLSTGTYLPLEKSYLYSASYDFSSMNRPMLSFDLYTQTLRNDGIALDFSIDTFNVADPKKKWYRLGTNADGSDWYNGFGLGSKPGSQTAYGSSNSSGDFGWTETFGKWVNSRHTISPDIPAVIPQTHVVFRFSLSVSSDVNTYKLDSLSAKGFAIDNFRVGERTRVVLLENFTNLGSNNPAERTQRDFFQRDFNPSGLGLVDVGTDYVKLNYHVGFPQQDPFNLENPSDPSSRALYYGVSSTPSAVMDGTKSGQIADAVASYNDRTLDLAAAKLTIVEADSTATGGYKAKIKVRALKSLPPTTVLHVVLAERKIIQSALSSAQLSQIAEEKGDTSSYEYVVRKMLPSASGTRFSADLDNDPLTTSIDSIKTFPSAAANDYFRWNVDNIFANDDDMVVIAFLQDEITRQVHQAVISPLMPDPPTVTGIEPINGQEINVYPNPADNELNVVLPVPAVNDVPVVLGDQMGRITHSVVIRKGEQSAVLQTSGNSAGVYILQMDLGNGQMARRKVIINHHK